MEVPAPITPPMPPMLSFDEWVAIQHFNKTGEVISFTDPVTKITSCPIYTMMARGMVFIYPLTNTIRFRFRTGIPTYDNYNRYIVNLFQPTP